jgi:hypothetical protein
LVLLPPDLECHGRDQEHNDRQRTNANTNEDQELLYRRLR